MEDEIYTAMNWLAALDVHSEYEASNKEYILSELERLQQENEELRRGQQALRK